MTHRRARTALGLAALLAITGIGWWGTSVQAAPARAASTATAEEAAALATQAINDDDALAELRRITVVDGRRVDLAAATARLGSDRAPRLRSLADTFRAADDGGGTALDRTQARDLAQQVLDDGKYQEKKAPRPFQGVLRWMADRMRPVGHALQPLLDAVAAVPGGPYLLLIALGGGVGWAGWYLARRRSGAVVGRSPDWRLVDPEQDPDQLDAQATAAEASGDHALAVRTRYEAGLIRLARAHRIELRPDTTAGAVAAELHDPTLQELTATFEAVVYGGRAADAADSERARVGWRAVLRAGAPA